MSTTTTPRKPITLNQPTRLTFHIAARSNVLRQYMGIDVLERPDDFVWKLDIYPHPRPWLVASPRNPQEHSLDSDRFAARLRGCSTSEGHMIRWLLNIYNPGYAASKRAWHFDLFAALGNLDEENRHAIAWHLQHPVWP